MGKNVKWIFVAASVTLACATACSSVDSSLSKEYRTWQANGVEIGLEGRTSDLARLQIDDVLHLSQGTGRPLVQGREVSLHSWPTNRDGMLFLWGVGDSENLVAHPVAGEYRDLSLRGRGWARLDETGAMSLTGGAYYLERANEELLAELKKSNELSLEATIMPEHLRQTGPARVVTFSSSHLSRNFTLGQVNEWLVFRIRTDRTDDNATRSETRLFRLHTDRPNHVIVSYKPGQLVSYHNGRRVVNTRSVQGDFRNWTSQHLVFGDEWDETRDWSGRLEGVAIYNRFIEQDEARRNFDAYTDIVRERGTVPGYEVRLRLVQDAFPAQKVGFARSPVSPPYRVIAGNHGVAPEVDSEQEAVDTDTALPEEEDIAVTEEVEVFDNALATLPNETQATPERAGLLPVWGWIVLGLLVIGGGAFLIKSRSGAPG